VETEYVCSVDVVQLCIDIDKKIKT